jgi:hypothetical protein
MSAPMPLLLITSGVIAAGRHVRRELEVGPEERVAEKRHVDDIRLIELLVDLDAFERCAELRQQVALGVRR